VGDNFLALGNAEFPLRKKITAQALASAQALGSAKWKPSLRNFVPSGLTSIQLNFRIPRFS